MKFNDLNHYLGEKKLIFLINFFASLPASLSLVYSDEDSFFFFSLFRNFIPSKAANTFGNNARKLYNALSSSAYFAARREEEISSVSYFARARNDQFNYSSNPTYSTGSIVDGVKTHGKFKVPSFQGDPRAYITQVGLYDDNSDLLAVAKLSQPILKSFSREAVVKVKLDY